MLRLKPKARAGPPSGQMMKALVENTFSAGVHEPIVDNQMMSTIRQQHITAYGTGEGQEGPYEMLPRRKLTLKLELATGLKLQWVGLMLRLRP